MKKLNKLLLAVVMMVTAFTLSAQEFSIGYLSYKVIDTSKKFVGVTGLTSSGKAQSNLNLVIPGRVSYNGTYYRVYRVESNAFLNMTNIVSCKMKFGMDILFAGSFQGCTNLTRLDLPSSLEGIRSTAFSGCTGLKNVYYAGFYFPSLGVTFPSNSGMNLYINPQSKRSPSEYKSQSGWSVFANVNYSVYAYDEWMVDGGFYTIGYGDQYGPTTTRSAHLTGFYSSSSDNTSNGTIYKPSYSEYSTSEVIPFSIDTIDTDGFQGQATLKTIDLTNATNIKMIRRIGPSNAVANVTRLVLPKSSFNYNTATFDLLTGVSAFELASGSTSYSIYDGSLYNYSKTTLHRVPRGKSGSMSYPSSLETLNTDSHENCTKITNAYLPYGVKTIYGYAFYGCSALQYIRIPSSVTTLSTYYVFKDINSNAYVYINMQNPPTITVSDYFGTNSSIDLYVPYGYEQTYKNKGWTGFYGYNRNAHAYDYESGVHYTVTSTASTTGIDGTSYNGRVKVVYGPGTRGLATDATVNIPNYITINSKKYAVTKIGEDAFNNNSNNFSVTGCANVDTIGEYAFQNQAIISYPFGHKSSRYILAYAFDGSSLRTTDTNQPGTIALPLGVQYLGAYCFGNGKYNRLIVPHGPSVVGTFCCNTTTLNELVLNFSSSGYYNFTGWDLTGVPSTCYIRVPTGVVNQWKQNSKLSSRASYITAGAYDFAWHNQYASFYHITITSTSSTTFNGTTYDGTAKYVYYTNNPSKTDCGLSTYEEDRTVSGDYRKYLITEIGDSCLAGAKSTSLYIPQGVKRIGHDAFYGLSTATTSNLSLPSGLTFIGYNAFRGCTGLTGEIKIPASVTTIEHDAFWNVSGLTALYFPGDMPTLGTDAWYSGSNLTVWVKNQYANKYLNECSKSAWSSGCKNRLAVWIKPTRSTVLFGSVVPTNFSGANINAYYASAYDKSNTTKQLTLTKANQAPENTGLLLLDLTPNKEYRIPRPTSTVSAPMTNYFVATPTSNTNMASVTVGYKWDFEANPMHFVKRTSAWYYGPGYDDGYGTAYLKLSSAEALDDVYTNLYPYTAPDNPYDLSGNGTVGIEDVNILINVMLFKDTDPTHVSKADFSGNGTVGIEDVNILINVMLHKN